MGELGFWFLLFLGSGLLALGCGGYRLLWTRRYESSAGRSLRIRGEVIGPGPRGTALHCGTVSGAEVFSRPLELRDRRGHTHRVIPGAPVLSGPRLRHPWLGELRIVSVGDRITVDGLPSSRARAESHYREACGEEWLEAVRISRGSWPELRWLRFPAVIAGLLCLTSAIALLFAPSPPCPCERAAAPPILARPGVARGLPLLRGTQVSEVLGSAAVEVGGTQHPRGLRAGSAQRRPRAPW
jgi:hypothetical protein